MSDHGGHGHAPKVYTKPYEVSKPKTPWIWYISWTLCVIGIILSIPGNWFGFDCSLSAELIHRIGYILVCIPFAQIFVIFVWRLFTGH